MPVLSREHPTGRRGRYVVQSALWLALVMLSGCASSWVAVAPSLPEEVERLGSASGEACGDLYLFTTPTQFLAHGWNERLERAYTEAVASVPGASALTDVTYSERWYWWVLASRRCVQLRGEAIR